MEPSDLTGLSDYALKQMVGDLCAENAQLRTFMEKAMPCHCQPKDGRVCGRCAALAAERGGLVSDWEQTRDRLGKAVKGHDADGSCAAPLHCAGCDVRAALDRVEELEAELDRPKHETLRQLADAVERYGLMVKRAEAAEKRVEELEKQLALIPWDKWKRAEERVEELERALAAWRHTPSLPDCLACSVLDVSLTKRAALAAVRGK